MPFESPLPALDVAADFWSLRFVEESSESYAVRKNVPQPLEVSTDRGVMATVHADGGMGYAATSDTSPAGLQNALDTALAWARATARMGLVDTRSLPRPGARGEYRSPSLDAPRLSRRDIYEMLADRVARGRDRSAHRRLAGARRRAHGDASPGDERRRRRRAALPLPLCRRVGDGARRGRHAAAHAVRRPRRLPAGRGRDPRARGLRRQRPPGRRGGARARARAELPERHDGRAARARPDDPADPRVDRAPAGTRPHPRRRAQLRRDELRHARHVRQLPLRLGSAGRHVRSHRGRASSRATAGTTTARRRRAST